MIGKIKTRTQFKGLLRYNQKGEIIDKSVLSDDISGQLKELKGISDQNPRVQNRAKHFILSFKKDKLSDSDLIDLSKEYLSQMGYEHNQHITYKHTDTDHLHLHIVVNRVRYDNLKAVKDGKDMYRSRNVIMKLEKKYNLTKTPRYSKNKATKKNTQAYKAAEQRLNKTGQKTDKQIIKEMIKTELERKPGSEQEFVKTLNNQGIKVTKNKAGNGYNFEYNGRTYKASSIHREYSFAKLNRQFEQNYKASVKNQRKQEKEQERKQREQERERQRKEQERERQRQEQKRKQQEQERAKQEFSNAVKEQNHKKIVDTARKNPDKKLNNSQIKYILNHPGLEKSDKILLLTSGGIEQPKQYFEDDKSQLDYKSIKNTMKERNKGKNKSNNLNI